jgi:hypothetical protein
MFVKLFDPMSPGREWFVLADKIARIEDDVAYADNGSRLGYVHALSDLEGRLVPASPGWHVAALDWSDADNEGPTLATSPVVAWRVTDDRAWPVVPDSYVAGEVISGQMGVAALLSPEVEQKAGAPYAMDLELGNKFPSRDALLEFMVRMSELREKRERGKTAKREEARMAAANEQDG